MIDAILTNSVLPTISRHFLERIAESKPIERVQINVANSDFAYEF
jgi:type VI secretion system protein VasG